MNTNRRILVAIDDSEASHQAVTYVARMIGKQEDIQVRLFHVLDPLPPEMLEFPGSENIETEERMDAAEQAAQEQWLETVEKAAQPVFTRAKAVLHAAGVPDRAVETQCCLSITRKDVAADIVEEARASRCGTVVVGRTSFSKLRELFQQHIADELVRRGHGLTIWVVE